MPLIKKKLESQLLIALKELSINSEKSIDDAQKKLAKDLASIIDGYIRSANITIQPGQIVTTSAGAGIVSSPSTPAIII